MDNQTVKFGIGQIGNPTPKWAKWVFRIVLYTAAVISLICDIVTEIPPDVKLLVLKYSTQAVALVHGLTRMFGISEDNQ